MMNSKFKGTTYVVPTPELASILTKNPCPIRFLLNKDMYVVTKLAKFGTAKPTLSRIDW